MDPFKTHRLRSFRYLLIGVFGFICLGTTYVITENEVEVGRWEEPDGKNDTQLISSEKPAPKSSHKLVEYSSDGGYTASFEQTEGATINYWKVSGQMRDLINLQGVSGATLTFTGGPEPIAIKTGSGGFFSGKLPALLNSSYSITCQPPSNYNPHCHLYPKPTLSRIPYEDRLKSYGSISFTGVDAMFIRSSTFDVEIAVQRTVLTPEEQSKYNELIQNIASGSTTD